MRVPIVIGVDVARYGDDQSVICVRQGRKVLELYKYRELNTIQLASRVIEKMRYHKPQAVFIDVGNTGGGVIDYILELGHTVIEANAANTADDNVTYLNKRAEMWGRMREWLESEVDIPDDPELADELCGLEYGYTALKFQIQLEKKEDMKARGLNSPDCADALGFTFFEHVAPGEVNELILPEDVEMEMLIEGEAYY